MSIWSQETELRLIDSAADYLRPYWTRQPRLAIVLGSGLGAMADAVSRAVSVDYSDIPGFAAATVAGHHGRLVIGDWDEVPVVVMQGRFHYYEGHDLPAVVRPMRVLQRLGVTTVILTNAAGGLDPDMAPGDLMLLSDHLGFFSESPLRGPNLDLFGERFIDQTQVYDRALRRIAIESAARLGLPLREGVYAYSRGPQYETPAEIRALRLLGADAVGMSTVPEAIVARHGGQRVVAISCISNMAAGMLDQPLNHQEVMEVGQRVANRTIRLLSAMIESWGESND